MNISTSLNTGKKILPILIFLNLGSVGYAQTITIPDPIFKQRLIATPGIDINGDGEIQIMEAFNYDNVIDCQGLPVITDLTGIEAFVMLEFLYCEGTQITSLDVSNLGALKRLQCQSTALTSLDLSNNVNLTYLSAQDNNLTSLNLANGNDTNMVYMRTLNNPSLDCIEVDDVVFSNTTWGSGNFAVDATTSFSLDCPDPVGILENEKEVLSIYPNPSTSQITISNVVSPILTIKIIDISGKTIMRINDDSNKINVSDLTKGIYFLQVQTEDGLMSNKFIKE
jgi:hypothetical protein